MAELNVGEGRQRCWLGKRCSHAPSYKMHVSGILNYLTKHLELDAEMETTHPETSVKHLPIAVNEQVCHDELILNCPQISLVVLLSQTSPATQSQPRHVQADEVSSNLNSFMILARLQYGLM